MARPRYDSMSGAVVALGDSFRHTAIVKITPCVGALLLLVGGTLDVARLVLFTLVSVPSPEFVTMSVYAVPSTCIGAGLIAIGVAIRGRGRLPLIAAGVLNLVAVVVNIVQIATHSPLGPAPSQLAVVVALTADVVAGALLLSNASLRGPARWAIAIPAGCVLLLLVSLFVPVLGLARFDLLPGIGFTIAGVVLLRQTRPHPAPA
jgi:hypothetical protein